MVPDFSRQGAGDGASGLRQPAAADGVPDDLDAAAQAELFHRAGLVRLDGLAADVELRGDVLGGVAPGDEPEDLLLAVAQLDAAAGPRRGDPVDEAPHHRAG